jgi:hypothetical protein
MVWQAGSWGQGFTCIQEDSHGREVTPLFQIRVEGGADSCGGDQWITEAEIQGHLAGLLDLENGAL